MKTFRSRNACHVASRVHRVDAQQQNRWSLVLIMIMGLATLSVLATTQSLSARDTNNIHFYLHR